MKTLAVLPCRIGSKRFAGKPLITIDEKTLLQHVYESAMQAKKVDKVLIATDSPEIEIVAKNFGADVVVTSENHKTGSDRVAAVAKKFPEFEIVLNIQVDALLIRGEMIDMLVEPLVNDSNIEYTAIKSKIVDENEQDNANIVKVVTDQKGFALYYSRAKIPFSKNRDQRTYFKNMGMYGFRRSGLLEYNKMKRTPLEKAESLEQLRILENGRKIFVVATDYKTIDISVPIDFQDAKEKYYEYYKKNR